MEARLRIGEIFFPVSHTRLLKSFIAGVLQIKSALNFTLFITLPDNFLRYRDCLLFNVTKY